jgi:hypothetical protein
MRAEELGNSAHDGGNRDRVGVGDRCEELSVASNVL